MSYYSLDESLHGDIHDLLAVLSQTKINYIGIGSILFAGVLTLAMLLKPLLQNIRDTMQQSGRANQSQIVARTEQDIPFKWVLISSAILSILLMALFYKLLPIPA